MSKRYLFGLGMRWNWLEFAGWCSLSSVFVAGACYLLSLLPLSDASRRIYEVGEFLTLIGWVGTLVVVLVSRFFIGHVGSNRD